GDRVAVDQPVAEVETAKAAVEVPCPFAGTVAALHAEAGAVVAVGAPLISITEEEPASGASSPGHSPGPALPEVVVPEARTPDSGPGGNGAARAPEGSGAVLVGYGTGAAAPRRPGRRRLRLGGGRPRTGGFRGGTGRGAGPAARCAGGEGRAAVPVPPGDPRGDGLGGRGRHRAGGAAPPAQRRRPGPPGEPAGPARPVLRAGALPVPRAQLRGRHRARGAGPVLPRQPGLRRADPARAGGPGGPGRAPDERPGAVRRDHRDLRGG